MIYRTLFKLVLVRIDAERAHALAVWILNTVTRISPLDALVRRLLQPTDKRLQVDLFDSKFPSPLGVAAGMDKEASCFDGLGAIGFGYVEVGTITASEQKGTVGKRVWRLPKDRAVLNAMGFPNPGARIAAERIRASSDRTIVGINLGKSKDIPLERAGLDYRAAVRQLGPLAAYIVLNVSSPNTAGLREMQAVDTLGTLIAEVRDELDTIGCPKPLLVKIAPDLTDAEIDAIADLAIELDLDGIVAVNTTVDRSGLVSQEPVGAAGRGGISGAPLKGRSLEILRRLYARVGDNVVLISVGGIETAEDVWTRIRAGATLVQAHTGFVYGGPLWPRRINRGLSKYLDGLEVEVDSIKEVVGTAAGPHRGDISSNTNGWATSPVDAPTAAGASVALARPPRLTR